ncbi:MAG TPA: transglycosylase SLT domain-containing protein [Stellaceae bacterium]|nr:transglycosylase SLT domain-containing protein [Stellaceae bacterium]
MRLLALSSVGSSHPHRPSSFPASRSRPGSVAAHSRAVILAAAVATALTMASGPAHARPAANPPLSDPSAIAPLAAFIAEASRRFGIPAAWIWAVMRAESAGETQAVSPKGAMGLMQIMPSTWVDLQRRYDLGANPYDAHDNIIAGAAYLRELLDRYGAPGFLAAYNAGPARWEDHLATGRPLPAETHAYLARLAPIVGNGAADSAMLLTSIARSWTAASLFPVQRSGAPAERITALRPPVHGKSNVRPVQDWTALAPTSHGLFVSLSSSGLSR